LQFEASPDKYSQDPILKKSISKSNGGVAQAVKASA
jgi:hypothetical protein